MVTWWFDFIVLLQYVVIGVGGLMVLLPKTTSQSYVDFNLVKREVTRFMILQNSVEFMS